MAEASVQRPAARRDPAHKVEDAVVSRPRKPTRDQLAAARGKKVPDVIRADLDVLLCGINPGLYSGAVGHHFARPGNRLWRALHLAGFTPRVLSAFEEHELLEYGIGITNLVNRATATAAEVSPDELENGGRRLVRKVRRLGPRSVAFLGIGAYRLAFGRPKAAIGQIEGGTAGARAWLLPNPSGLNAHYQIDDLARAYGELRRALDLPDRRNSTNC
jgi:TDG/mug DNA glycosylase family protein